MDFALKMLIFALKMLIFVFEMMNVALIMIDLTAPGLPASPDFVHGPVFKMMNLFR